MKNPYFLIILLFLIRSATAQDPYFIRDIKKGNEINCVAYSPDGKKIIAGYLDGSARIINLETQKTEVEVEGHWKGVMAVEMDPNGKYFMTAGDNTIKIWSPEGEHIYDLTSHTTTICTADVHPGGKKMVSGAINRVFKEWDVLGGELLRNIKGHTDVAMAVAYSPDGKRIASGSGDHTIRIWDASTAEQIMTLNGHSDDIYAVSFSPDGSLLASCSKDKSIRIYDLKKGELTRILKGHKNFVMDVEFSPDGLHLLSCSFDQQIKVWEIPTGNCIYSFIDHEAEITDVCFAPDGKSFASASYDKKIKIWQFSPEIFVDYYYSPEVIEKMNGKDIFLPRQDDESRKDFRTRQQESEKVKAEIYREYYRKYLTDLKNGTLPGT